MGRGLFEQLDIHAHFTYSKGLVGYLAKLSTRIPLVVMIHGHDILSEPDAGFGLRSSKPNVLIRVIGLREIDEVNSTLF